MPKLAYTTPPPSLMQELNEVAADAGALAIELTKANRLPSDFPINQVQELLEGLQALRVGQAKVVLNRWKSPFPACPRSGKNILRPRNNLADRATVRKCRR